MQHQVYPTQFLACIGRSGRVWASIQTEYSVAYAPTRQPHPILAWSKQLQSLSTDSHMKHLAYKTSGLPTVYSCLALADLEQSDLPFIQKIL